MKQLLILTLATALGCGFFPEKVSFDDPRVTALLNARQQVDTESLGFTGLVTLDDLRLEESEGAYDAMLHVYGQTSRTIAFRATDAGWRWTGEQEIHTGPKTFEHPDGTMNERVTITYEIEPISGVPLEQVHINYWGEDPRLSIRPDLTLTDVQPILLEWKNQKVRPN